MQILVSESLRTTLVDNVIRKLHRKVGITSNNFLSFCSFSNFALRRRACSNLDERDLNSGESCSRGCSGSSMLNELLFVVDNEVDNELCFATGNDIVDLVMLFDEVARKADVSIGSRTAFPNLGAGIGASRSSSSSEDSVSASFGGRASATLDWGELCILSDFECAAGCLKPAAALVVAAIVPDFARDAAFLRGLSINP